MLYYKKPTSGEVYAYETEHERNTYGSPELVQMTDAEVAAYINPPQTTEQIIAEYTAAVQKRLDDFAQTRGYDSILSVCTYATSAVAKFAAEGQYAVSSRDQTWNKCYEIMASVQSGATPMPTLDDLLAQLPPLAWPL